MRMVLEGDRLIEVDGKKIEGSCNRCGLCCSVYRSGFPCEALAFEKVNDKQVAFCDPKIIHAGYFGRYRGCVAYPLPDNVLPTCGYRYR